MILLGLVHIGFVFPIDGFDSYQLWFIGAGIAIIFSGLLNIIAVVNCRQRWLGIISLACNAVMLGLFILALDVLKEPQVYIGISLYLAAILVRAIQFLNKVKGVETIAKK